MLPFHALLFRLRLIVESPCFITSDDSLQEGLSFFVKPIKEFSGNVKAVLLVLRRKHLRYLVTAHLGKFEHFTDYVMSCTCGYVQLLGYFFNSYPPFSKNQVGYCLLFFGVFTSEGLPCLGSSLILVCPLNLSIHLYISLVQTTTPILGRHSSIDFTWFYTFCSKKSDHSSLSFMCCPPREQPSKKN